MASLKQIKGNLKKSKKNIVKKTKKGGDRRRTKPQKHIKPKSNKGTKKAVLAALAATLGLSVGAYKNKDQLKKATGYGQLTLAKMHAIAKKIKEEHKDKNGKGAKKAFVDKLKEYDNFNENSHTTAGQFYQDNYVNPRGIPTEKENQDQFDNFIVKQ